MKPEIIIEMLQTNCQNANNALLSKKLKREMTNAEIIAALQTPRKNLTRFGGYTYQLGKILIISFIQARLGPIPVALQNFNSST